MMLILEKCIGKGATRECYRHPADASKCVKVLIKNTDTSILKRELKYYIDTINRWLALFAQNH